MKGLNTKKLLILAVLLILFLTPVTAAAQTGIWDGVSCNQPNQPPCTFCDALVVTNNVINFLWEFALALGGLMIAVGAIILMASGGNPKRQQWGKDALTYAVIGIAIALLSWVIINTVIMMLTGGGLSDWNSPTCDESTPYLIPAPDAPEPGEAEGGVVDNSGGGLLESCRSSSPQCDSGLVCTGGICKLENGEDCEIDSGGAGDNDLCASGNCECLDCNTSTGIGTTFECRAGGDCPISPLNVPHDKWGILGVNTNPSDSDVQRNVDALVAELNRLEGLLPDGASFTETSIYRPYTYQQHLYEVVDRRNQCQDNGDSECLAFCADIEQDYNEHGLVGVVASPSDCAPHVKGIAVDLNVTWPNSNNPYLSFANFLNNNNSILVWPNIAGDPNHYEIRPPDQPYDGCNNTRE